MGLEESFRVMGMSRAPGVPTALVQVLKCDDAELSLAAAEALLNSPTPRGNRALIHGYLGFAQKVRERISSRIYRIKDELRGAVLSEDPLVRAATLELLAGSTATDVMPLLATYLGSKEARVREHALDAFLRAAWRFADDWRAYREQVRSDPRGESGPSSGPLMRERLALAKAGMAAALAELRFHRDGEVIDAALAAGDSLYETIAEALRRGGEATDPEVRLMILGWLAASGSLDGSRFLFWLLGHRSPMMRKFAARVFAARSEGEGRETVLDAIRLLEPDYHRKLVRLNKGFPWLLPLEGRMGGLPPEVPDLLARELEKVKLEPSDRAVWLRLLADTPDITVSRRALDALASMPPEAAVPQFEMLVDSRKEHAALVAIEHLAAAGHSDLPKLLVPRVNSESPRISALSRRVIARQSFTRYVAVFDRLEPEVAKSVGETAIKLDADAALVLLPELHHGRIANRIKALRITRLLGLAGRLQWHIIPRTLDSDSEVRAHAAAALGSTKGERLGRAALAALEQALTVETEASVRDAIENAIAELAAEGGVLTQEESKGATT